MDLYLTAIYLDNDGDVRWDFSSLYAILTQLGNHGALYSFLDHISTYTCAVFLVKTTSIAMIYMSEFLSSRNRSGRSYVIKYLKIPTDLGDYKFQADLHKVFESYLLNNLSDHNAAHKMKVILQEPSILIYASKPGNGLNAPKVAIRETIDYEQVQTHVKTFTSFMIEEFEKLFNKGSDGNSIYKFNERFYDEMKDIVTKYQPFFYSGRQSINYHKLLTIFEIADGFPDSRLEPGLILFFFALVTTYLNYNDFVKGIDDNNSLKWLPSLF